MNEIRVNRLKGSSMFSACEISSQLFDAFLPLLLTVNYHESKASFSSIQTKKLSLASAIPLSLLKCISQ